MSGLMAKRILVLEDEVLLALDAAETLEELKTLGVEVHELSKEELAKMEELTAPLYEQFGSLSPETAEMIKQIRALG